jgi:hypothetical protein
MGFLDRVVGGANTAYEKWSDLTTITDPTLGAASKRMADGDVAVGTVTGIHRRFNEVTEDFIGVTARDAAGEVHRFGIQVALGTVAMSRLRLGMQVPMRIDGKKAVLDGPALGAALGVDLADPTQRSKRSAPDDGIEDTARDARVLKRLKTWPRSTATLTGFDPIFVLGMRTESWDVQVRLADGSAAVASKEQVPFYVQSLVAPGTEVPVATDPAGGTVAIDWPAFAMAVAGASDPTTPPAPASVAERLSADARDAAEAASAAVQTSPPAPAAPPPGVITNPSLQAWVDGVNGGWMKAKELDEGARDLVEAGMVTQEEADTARRAAGLL